jgi:hypothetical protein
MTGHDRSAGGRAITTVNYPSPVTVNGYSCKNCTDVDYAKQHIDPAHPKDGPYGIDAKDNPSPAVTFGGALAGVSAASGAPQPPNATQGLRLDVSA